jgi:hypothetical protein
MSIASVFTVGTNPISQHCIMWVFRSMTQPEAGERLLIARIMTSMFSSTNQSPTFKPCSGAKNRNLRFTAAKSRHPPKKNYTPCICMEPKVGCTRLCIVSHKAPARTDRKDTGTCMRDSTGWGQGTTDEWHASTGAVGSTHLQRTTVRRHKSITAVAATCRGMMSAMLLETRCCCRAVVVASQLTGCGPSKNDKIIVFPLKQHYIKGEQTSFRAVWLLISMEMMGQRQTIQLFMSGDYLCCLPVYI